MVAGKLYQREAARRIDLTIRQVKRLVRRYRQQGAAGLASDHRGKRANNAIHECTRQ